MPKAHVFAPGHLTGVFQICIDPNDPLMTGARGSGISLSKGVHTRVNVEPSRRSSHSIYINDEEMIDAYVSENVLSKYLSMIHEPYEIEVKHTIDTPLTAGFGSSGGGAISLSLALNKAMYAGLSRVEATQLAHVAEIECKTGLGSVFAADKGGFGVLYKPGAPGIGAGIFFDDPSGLKVIYIYFGPIHTKEALSNPNLIAKINQIGGNYVDELHSNLTPERFLKYSRQFTDHVGLVTPSVKKVFDLMDSEGYTFTMAMFGDVAYTVQPKEEIDSILGILEKINSEPVVCDIDTLGTIFQLLETPFRG